MEAKQVRFQVCTLTFCIYVGKKVVIQEIEKNLKILEEMIVGSRMTLNLEAMQCSEGV